MRKNNNFTEDYLNKDFIYVAVIIASMGTLLFGYDSGVISSAYSSIEATFHPNTFLEIVILSSLLIGACISAAFSGHFADYLGRRKLLLIDSVIFVLGAVGSASSQSITELIIYRFIVGIAVGISSYVVPLYVSEIAPTKNRGFFVCFSTLFIIAGLVLSFIIGYILNPTESWQLMLAMGVIPAIILFCGMLNLPESPRWLLANQLEDQARTVLGKFIPEESIEAEMAAIKDGITTYRSDWRLLFKPWLKPAVVIGVGIAIFQQIIGLDAVLYSAPMLLKSAGFPQNTGNFLATVVLGLILFTCSIPVLFLIDYLGRRPLFIFGAIGISIGFIGLGISFSLLPWLPTLAKWMILISILTYVISFMNSYGIVAWLMITEIFPLRVRGLGMSLATSIIWGFNFIVTLTFTPLLNLISDYGIFILYSIFCIASIFFAYFFIPETKGIALERIEINLRAGKRSRDLGQ